MHSIIFGYYFAIMKLYALFTLHETGWGTRAGIGEPEKAGEAANEQADIDNAAATARSSVPMHTTASVKRADGYFENVNKRYVQPQSHVEMDALRR